MKGFLTALLCCLSFSATAQLINFDWDGVALGIADYQNYITIDTVNYHNNKWQVGPPQKAVFDTAYSFKNVIVTDTINSYGINDTSVFILKIPVHWPLGSGIPWRLVPLSSWTFHYKLDVDSNIRAVLEISLDTGKSWSDKDSLPEGIHWDHNSDFSVSNAEWKTATMYMWASFDKCDTLLFRFSLISDSDATGKDGWMIDDINLEYWWDAVNNTQNPNLISLYPNPSKGNIHFHSPATQQNATIAIYNSQGQEVYKTDKLPQDGNLHLHLPDGIYTLRYTTDEEYCTRRITILN